MASFVSPRQAGTSVSSPLVTCSGSWPSCTTANGQQQFQVSPYKRIYTNVQIVEKAKILRLLMNEWLFCLIVFIHSQITLLYIGLKLASNGTLCGLYIRSTSYETQHSLDPSLVVSVTLHLYIYYAIYTLQSISRHTVATAVAVLF